jgi:hypothetical protein
MITCLAAEQALEADGRLQRNRDPLGGNIHIE